MNKLFLALMFLVCSTAYADEVITGLDPEIDLPVINEELRKLKKDIRDAQAAADSVSTVTVASQAQMEAATVNTVYASPGRTQNHPGVAKGWAKVDGSGGSPTLSASHNVSAVVDYGVGHYKIEWDTNFSSANHSDIAVAYRSGTGGTQIVAQILEQDATSTTVYLTDAATAPIDSLVYVAAFGDQ